MAADEARLTVELSADLHLERPDQVALECRRWLGELTATLAPA